MGGRLAYVAAATAGVDAAVAYYGGGIQDMPELAPKITCPMQFHYGALDASIPPAAVDKVRTAMAGKPAEVFVYERADHGFNCWAHLLVSPCRSEEFGTNPAFARPSAAPKLPRMRRLPAR